MLERNLPLVRSVVDRMRIFLPAALDIQDLYTVGFQGLVNAISKFDPTQGTVFSAFAAFHIRGAVRDELRRMDWTPRSVREKAKKVRESLERLEQRIGRPASEAEVAVEMGISLEDYWAILDEIRPVSFIPLDEDWGGEAPDGLGGHQKLADDSQSSPRDDLEKKELHQFVLEQMMKMPELQKKVLAMYYFQNMRLSEIAAVFNLTEGRISQIHTQAVLSLRNFVKRLNNSILCS